MLELRVEIPKSERLRLARLLDPQRLKWAEAEALNRTAANVQAESLRLVSAEMGIPVSKLRKRGRRTQVTGSKFGAIVKGKRATRRFLSTSIRGYGRPFNVIRWGAQEINAGASTSARTRRSRKGKGKVLGVTHAAYGRTQFARGTFILQANGGRFVAVRTGAARGALRGVFGPGVVQMLERPHVYRALQRYAREQFGVHFASRVAYAFSPAFHGR